MKLLHNDIPSLKFGSKILPSEVANYGYLTFGNVWWVDGNSGDNNNDGKTGDTAFLTIANAISEASAGDTILIKAKTMAATDTDPSSYAETVTLSKTLNLVGLPDFNRTQGGLPQIKIGAGSTAMITVAAPGCTIMNLGINGASSTGGGILLDDDGGTTSAAFGTTIRGCHFKNCAGSDATGAETGGAIMWSSDGGAWQTSIVDNQFYKNVGDITLMGTSGSVPQDVLIAGNDFLGTAAAVDCHIYMGGSGMASFTIRDNYFADVLPALSGGNNQRYVILVGTGLFANNYVAGSYTSTGWGAARAAGVIPTTVGIAHNYSDGGLIVRQ